MGGGAVTVFGGTLDLDGTTRTISSLALGGGAAGSVGTGTITLGGGTLRYTPTGPTALLRNSGASSLTNT